MAGRYPIHARVVRDFVSLETLKVWKLWKIGKLESFQTLKVWRTIQSLKDERKNEERMAEEWFIHPTFTHRRKEERFTHWKKGILDDGQFHASSNTSNRACSHTCVAHAKQNKSSWLKEGKRKLKGWWVHTSSSPLLPLLTARSDTWKLCKFRFR